MATTTKALVIAMFFCLFAAPLYAVQEIGQVKPYSLDDDGAIMSGCRYTFEAGTTTDKATYTTSALSVAHSNPQQADARGEFAPAWYINKIKVALGNPDEDGNCPAYASADIEWTVDNWQGQGSTILDFATLNDDYDCDMANLDTGTYTDGEKDIYVDCDDTLAAAVSVHSDIRLIGEKGATITMGAYNLTISGPLQASKDMFTLNGAGDLAINGGITASPTDRLFVISSTGLANIKYIPPQVGWWGGIGDGSTDSTTPIQQAINCAARNDTVQVLFTAGEYLFTKLYLHYDAANNPNFPSTDWRGGRVHLIGKSMADKLSVNASLEYGTRLRSTNATGPAIYAFGDPNTTSVWANNVRIENMMLEATNTTYILEYKRVNQMSGGNDLLVIQNGAGGGIKHWDITHTTTWENVKVVQKGGTNGIGWYITNSSGISAGGIHLFKNCHADSFTTGWKFGDDYGNSAAARNFDLVGCQAISCTTGFYVGEGIDGWSFRAGHIEVSTTGVIFQSTANRINMTGNFFYGNDVDVQIGTGTDDDEDAAKFLEFKQNNHVADAATVSFFKIYTAGTISRISISQSVFAGGVHVPDRAIELEDGHYYALEIKDCSVSGVTNFIADSGNNDMTDRVPFLRGIAGASSTNDQIWGTSSGLPGEVAYWFKQLHTTGLYAPLGLSQADTNQSVLDMVAEGTLRVWVYQDDAFADDGTNPLPDETAGIVLFSCGSEAGVWLVETDETTTKIAGTANTDDDWATCDTKICVYESGVATRGVLGNRLGSAQECRAIFFYN